APRPPTLCPYATLFRSRGRCPGTGRGLPASHDQGEMMSKKAFGIDIGGSGIKGAPVHLGKGDLAADRVRIPTPQPSTPEAVADTVAELIGSFDVAEDMPVGVTFPAVI